MTEKGIRRRLLSIIHWHYHIYRASPLWKQVKSRGMLLDWDGGPYITNTQGGCSLFIYGVNPDASSCPLLAAWSPLIFLSAGSLRRRRSCGRSEPRRWCHSPWLCLRCSPRWGPATRSELGFATRKSENQRSILLPSQWEMTHSPTHTYRHTLTKLPIWE